MIKQLDSLYKVQYIAEHVHEEQQNQIMLQHIPQML